MDFSDMSKRLGRFTQVHAPAILTAVGVVGTLTTAYLTGKATIKAVKMVEQEEAYRGYDFEAGERLTAVEMMKTAWVCYIPPVTTATVTIAAIILSNRVSSRRVASVATALAIGEKAFSEYKDKVVEKFGEGKERSVRDDIAQDHVKANPPEDRLVIITDGGHVLCRDEYSGRYFNSSMEELRKAENDINFRILHDGDVSLTEFYSYLGLPQTSHSDDLGWNTDEPLKVVYSTALTDQSKPCICITFDVAPYPAFYKNSH